MLKSVTVGFKIGPCWWENFPKINVRAPLLFHILEYVHCKYLSRKDKISWESFFINSHLRFTVPYGIPVGVSKAGSNLVPTSSANLKSGPEQGQPSSKGTPAFLAIKCALSRPPTIRILVSNTETLILASNDSLSAKRS